MATKVEKNAKQVDNDEGNNNNNFVISQTITAERNESFKTSMSGVAIFTERRPLPSIHNTCLPFGERIDQQTWSLLLSEETEPDLFNETFCSRCIDSSSKSQGKIRFCDSHRQERMQHKKSSTDFKLVNLNSDDTRLVDGLLTTTLCSTEL